MLSQVENDTWSLFHYQEERVRTIIHGLKYGRREDLAPFLATLIAPHLDHIVDEDHAIIIPIPSAQKELKERGFDHVALLAEAIVGAYHGPIQLAILPALRKVRETTPQVKTKNRSERLSNLVEAYEADKHIHLQGKIVLLIDDVTTTGATFTEARRALAHSGTEKIVCLAIAH